MYKITHHCKAESIQLGIIQVKQHKYKIKNFYVIVSYEHIKELMG